MTLEELRSRLIEVCKGKVEFVESLEMIADRVNSGCWRFDSYNRGISESYEQPNYFLDCPPDLDCGDCPMNNFRHIEGIDCRCSNLHIPNMEADKLKEFANETLSLAIASCKGEEVKVEEEVPVDNPSKPLFIVTKVDDLIGLESEDGKFEIKDSFDSCIEYVVVGKSTDYTYLDFLKKDAFNDEVVACLEELGFRFIIERKKSYLELLEECEEVKFERGESNWYVYSRYDGNECAIEVGHATVVYTPGIKYISREDADRIVKECVENA